MNRPENQGDGPTSVASTSDGPLFAGVATADLRAALAWYVALFGRDPDIVVSPTEVMWRHCDGGWIYLVEDASRAGRALVALAVSNLDLTLDEIAGRGLTTPEVELIERAGRKASMVDPEGNSLALIHVNSPT